MYCTLFSIIDELNIPADKWFSSNVHESEYEYCLWLGTSGIKNESGCIYVGYASQLPDGVEDVRAGFILVNDTDRDLSGIGSEVVELDPSADPAEICLMIRDRFFQEHEVSSACKSLIGRLLMASQVRELVDIIADILENPVFLNFHFFGQMFYFSGTSESDDQVSALRELKRDFHDDDMIASINRIWDAGRPELTEDGFIYPGHRRIQTAISEGHGSKNRIGIITVFEVNRKFRKEDYALLGLISYFISERAGDRDFKAQISGYKYEQFFHSLLRGDTPSERPAWISQVFGSRSRNFRLTVLDLYNINAMDQNSIRYHLLQVCGFSVCFMRGTYLVDVANLEPEQESKLEQTLRMISNRYSVSIGLSDNFTDILQFKKYYLQARQARENGSGKDRKPGLYRFSEYRDSLLARTLINNGTADLYINEAYDTLRRMDEEDGTEYCYTLETFIACGLDHAKTTKLLNIHRNTLSYRLGRIEEITGRSLKDGSFLKEFLLSSAIRKESDNTAI